MSLKFDRSAPEGGIRIQYRWENGKVLLQFDFRFDQDPAGQNSVLRVRLINAEERSVLECLQRAEEEEPLRAVLLHPSLWQGVENPYLYRLEVELKGSDGEVCDRCVRSIPLYCLEIIAGQGVLLNGNSFCPRTVRYRVTGERTDGGQNGNPSPAEASDNVQLYMLRDLQLLRKMGANGIFAEGLWEKEAALRQLCNRLGLLLWEEGDALPEKRESMPLFFRAGRAAASENSQSDEAEGGCDNAEKSLMGPDDVLTPLYYEYCARWSRQPFVYLVPESVVRQKNGRFRATVYSNCKKVALYSDGILHEFQSGEVKFHFREITGSGPCLTLTAEAQECAHSVSLHKTFTNSSLFHDISPLE